MTACPAANVTMRRGGRTVPYLDTLREPQLHKPNRLSEPGRVMGESPDSRAILLGASPAFAGPPNISQAYGQWAEGSFPVFGPLWKTGKRRLALRGGRRTDRPARGSGFRELDAALAIGSRHDLERAIPRPN